MKATLSFKPALILVLAGVVFSASIALSKDKEPAVFSAKGEIMDSQCAMNVHSMDHSHDAMVKKGVFGNDARSCTQHCVRDGGGSYVLLVKDRVYRLDDQLQSEAFSGKKVKVTGPLDERTQTIHVFKIEEDH